ncbi:MAG: ergothioneine biosynthesis protein EgtB [Holophagaceae bacterium]|nr:ergothioneine biosynthesis protein EgtB [Holophagaceae bacterium]
MSGALPRYLAVRGKTTELSAPLTPEDQVVQAMPDASPTKWHLAHTTWFFETFILVPGLRDYRLFDPAYGFLFNSYYNAIGQRQPRNQRGLLTRPGLQEILAYRRHVDAAMEAFLQTSPGPDPALLELGLNHEQQHQELILTDIKYLLGSQPLKPAYRPAPTSAPTPAPPSKWIAFDEGLRAIGHGGKQFAFDNEGPRHKVFVNAFELASRPVSSGEYLEFMHDGGYAKPELWLSDGWDAVRAQRWDAPLHWRKSEEGWKVFTLQGEQELDPGRPVCHLSHYEADAYARWAGARLPTEFEWEAASGHPAPAQTSGDVWEWTASAYLPYPGFRIAEGAVGEYNGKFMSGQMVLRGGSVATPPGHIRPTYRNFFPPSARWQFSGLRLAR